MKKLILASLLALSLSASAQQAGNLAGTLLPSASRATSVVSPDQTNQNWRGGQIVLDVSTYSAGTLTPTIQGKDAASGKYYTVLTGSAVSSTSTNVMRVYPGLAAGANIANDVLPRVWRISVTASGVTPVTYSIGVNLEQ